MPILIIRYLQFAVHVLHGGAVTGFKRYNDVGEFESFMQPVSGTFMDKNARSAHGCGA